MAESGCLRDMNVGNLEVDSLNVSGYNGRFMDFLVGTKASIINATGATISQANGVTGEQAADYTAAAAYTLVANAESTFAGDGEAATLINLPAATRGTLCVLRITGDIDNTGVVTIQTNSADDVYEKQVISAGGPGGVTTAGTPAAPTTTELQYTAAGANTNFLGIGSEIFFYCATAGRWLVKVRHVPEGVGSTGAFSENTP